MFDWDDCSFVSPSFAKLSASLCLSLPHTHTDTHSNTLQTCTHLLWSRLEGFCKQKYLQSHVMCEYFRRIRGIKGRKERGGDRKRREGGMAYHIKFPKDIMTQKQKLINQPVPELSLSLFCPFPRLLVPAFISSSLTPSLPPPRPPTLLRGSWGSSDAVTPGFPLSFCCSHSAVRSLLPPTSTFFHHLSVFSEHPSKSHRHLLWHNGRRVPTGRQWNDWQICLEKAKTSA